MRFLSPIILLGTAGFIFWYNATHSSSVVMLPFVDRFVDDMAMRGHVSAGFFLVLGLFVLVVDIFRSRGNKDV